MKGAAVKVQIGVSRNQSKQSSKASETKDRPAASSAALDVSASTSSSALVDFCDSGFLRNKRKLDNGQSKVLNVDSDFKSKKTSAARPADYDYGAAAGGGDTDPRDLGPRVEIINGQIVIKESSLMIANQDSMIAEGEYEEVEEGVHAGSRYSSFLNKRKSKSWGIEETRLFYKALQQCGTEFSIMETFFPTRSRKELKLKFFREENQHPELVKRALDSSQPLDMEQFEKEEIAKE
mmetsp:Transcript_5668/g.12473  ORF Transcript_5668/g.12473 Transcript_5668/m.12473 type:complete len:236 (+) Transcript_5668:156-863(+)